MMGSEQPEVSAVKVSQAEEIKVEANNLFSGMLFLTLLSFHQLLVFSSSEFSFSSSIWRTGIPFLTLSLTFRKEISRSN
jgi:hypothetical protein